MNGLVKELLVQKRRIKLENNKTAKIIVGAQWGDEGKGKISAYIVASDGAKYVARAGTGPNAEHGIFLKDEKTYLKTNQLPLGWIFSDDAKICIGSGVAIDSQKLFAEMFKYKLSKERIILDYRSPIITPENIINDASSTRMREIGSTMSGVGPCRSDFINRIAKQVRDFPDTFSGITGDVGAILNDACKRGEEVVIESSQGTLLSLAASPFYPNVTSDNVTATAAMDDVLLNWQYVRDVVLVVKSMPTREGSRYSDGDMGKVEELSPEEIESMGLFEPSSIGGKMRRKAKGIDFDLLKYAVEINGATQIALTFIDHYDPESKNAKVEKDLGLKARLLIDKIEDMFNIPVTFVDTGKAYNNIIDMRFHKKALEFSRIDEKLVQFV